MARKGDIGPYSPENVECLTNTQNHQARHPNGSVARGEIESTLIEKQVKEIYLATDKLKNLAQRYSVGITAIESIKRGKTWKHITKDLGPAHRNRRGPPLKVKIPKPRKNRKNRNSFSRKVKIKPGMVPNVRASGRALRGWGLPFSKKSQSTAISSTLTTNSHPINCAHLVAYLFLLLTPPLIVRAHPALIAIAL